MAISKRLNRLSNWTANYEGQLIIIKRVNRLSIYNHGSNRLNDCVRVCKYVQIRTDKAITQNTNAIIKSLNRLSYYKLVPVCKNVQNRTHRSVGRFINQKAVKKE